MLVEEGGIVPPHSACEMPWPGTSGGNLDREELRALGVQLARGLVLQPVEEAKSQLTCVTEPVICGGSEGERDARR